MASALEPHHIACGSKPMTAEQACDTERREFKGPLSLAPRDWWCVVQGVRATAQRANLALIAGGVAFFGLMAVIPGIAALVALVGLFGDPAWIGDQIAAMGGVAPDAVVSIISTQVAQLLAARDDTLFGGAVLNLLIALWSALQGTRWSLMALTAVNRRADKRGGWGRYLKAGVFTLSSIGLGVLAIVLMGVAPLVMTFLHFESGAEAMVLVLRWPVLGGAAVAVALILYRWGPRRRPPPWRWLWPGAVAAPVLWVLASSALTFALREFPAFGATYGSLASALALLLWLYVTALVFLLGGALNAELEFFAHGRPTQPVAPDETIEPRTGADGGKKQVKENTGS